MSENLDLEALRQWHRTDLIAKVYERLQRLLVAEDSTDG